MKKLSAAAAMLMVMAMSSVTYAAYDENLNNYTLDTVVVEQASTKNKFGDTITEQSYYRTGGDVKVITREEIEKRHYTDVTEAIKRIPGIHFQNPGYRGNGEYGWVPSQNATSINGDARTLVLVDGRRVDNPTSTKMGTNSHTATKSTNVNLDQIVNMENVEKIEVIKGPGASQYGEDATGGVINIITRKGSKENHGSVDVSTGSLHKHKYALSYSGAAGNDKSWRYFVSANRDMSQDTKYHDGVSGNDGELYGSRYKEDGANIRIDKEFNDKQNLKIWYNYKQGYDGFPLTVPAQQYMNTNDWNATVIRQVVAKDWDADALADGLYKIPEGGKGAGWSFDVPEKYRNMFAVDGAFGAFSKFKNRDFDIQYTFNKDNGMESYVRVYDQKHKYAHRDLYVWGINPDGTTTSSASQKLTDKFNEMFPGGATAAQVKEFADQYLVPFPGDKEKMAAFIKAVGGSATEPTSWKEENNRGFQLQYAKSVGVNDIIASVTYDKSKLLSVGPNRTTGIVETSTTERKTTRAYIQDKIHVNDKWDITPAIRYVKYSSFRDISATGVETETANSASHQITPSVSTQYMFDDTASMYASWTKIYRPIRKADYGTNDQVAGGKLKDEKGAAMTFGFKKDITEKTTAAVHYDWTRMSNYVVRASIWNNNTGDFGNLYANAKEDKKSFNMTLDHKFNDHLNMSMSYSHTLNKLRPKGDMTINPDYILLGGTNMNTAINRMRPANHYAMNWSYENRKLYSGLLINYYTGADDTMFTNNHFLILDWNINYKVTKDLTVYGAVTNLTNEAYETSYNSSYGRGAAAMPGRCIMVGLKYTF